MSTRNVWAVVYGNYGPPEVHSLWETEELAQKRADMLGSPWRPEQWVVGGEDEGKHGRENC